ncbi:hypothetical protein KR093_001327 [Drosophila rubida]|uniref:Homeobox domain-containing protein n=1 Tax=Drosophila rubida TaxID=30044 RepID=A0AAD4K486_9MUSC|nr:hypothetical protein KR093_001327 [Drosophila rubida]
MVSHYYNTLPYAQKHSAANLAYASAAAAGQPWNWNNYHTGPNHQFLSDVESPHAAHHAAAAAAHPMYYNPHHMFSHSSAGDWHSPAASSAAAAAASDNFVQNVPTSAHQQLMHPHHAHHINSGLASGGSSSSASSGSSSSAPVVGGPSAGGGTQLNETNGSIGPDSVSQVQQQQQQHIAEGLPSPPITVSGSEISSPGAPTSASSPHHLTHHLAASSNNNNSPSTHNNNNNNSVANNNNNHRTSPAKAQYYDWMKKPSYPAQPQPELCSTPNLDDFSDILEAGGKTRTKDKYRVVYTDYQRLELEKEYCTSRYITIRRKSELAQTLSLSERQVKIWFQNRRAKERKQNKKGSDPNVMGGVQHTDYSQLLDAKTKLEPGLHLQHPLHSMNPMAMNLPAMRLHPHLAAHSHSLAAAAAHSHLQQQHSAQMSAAAVGVGTLSM